MNSHVFMSVHWCLIIKLEIHTIRNKILCQHHRLFCSKVFLSQGDMPQRSDMSFNKSSIYPPTVSRTWKVSNFKYW